MAFRAWGISDFAFALGDPTSGMVLPTSWPHQNLAPRLPRPPGNTCHHPGPGWNSGTAEAEAQGMHGFIGACTVILREGEGKFRERIATAVLCGV